MRLALTHPLPLNQGLRIQRAGRVCHGLFRSDDWARRRTLRSFSLFGWVPQSSAQRAPYKIAGFAIADLADVSAFGSAVRAQYPFSGISVFLLPPPSGP
jgi:hypothetical protein